MALRPDEFFQHALAAADGEHRLPLARMTGWDISPFEPDGLRVSPLRPPVLPEPARHGEDPSTCDSCRNKDTGLWFNDRWRLTRIAHVGVPLVLMLHPREHFDMHDLPDDLAAELGVLTAHIVRHVQALQHISRAHVYKIGDGGAHLHIWFFARPEGQAQLYGSWLVVWDDLLPEYPAEVADADAVLVVDALIASYGGSRSPDLLNEQIAYYRLRATEYDATAYGDLAIAGPRIARLVAEMNPCGRVLEIACGTGLWTQAMAKFADSVLAIDAAPEALAIARDRVPSGNVTFEVADVFSWTTNDRFDVIFFSAWLSHIPTSRHDAFWQQLRGLLTANGRVLFIDEHVDESEKETYVAPETVERQLNDGRRFRVVKNFVEPQTWQDRLRAIGWHCEIRRDGNDWIVGEARPV